MSWPVIDLGTRLWTNVKEHDFASLSSSDVEFTCKTSPRLQAIWSGVPKSCWVRGYIPSILQRFQSDHHFTELVVNLQLCQLFGQMMTTETQVLATHRGSILALLRHPLQLLCLSGLHLILLARIHCLVAKLDVLLSRLTLFMPLLNTSTVLMMNFQKLLSFYQKRGSMRYLQASYQLQQYDGDTTQAFKFCLVVLKWLNFCNSNAEKISVVMQRSLSRIVLSY